MNEYVPDHLDQWEQYEAKQSRREETADRCTWCGEPLGDTYFELPGAEVCEDCIDSCRRYA